MTHRAPGNEFIHDFINIQIVCSEIGRQFITLNSIITSDELIFPVKMRCDRVTTIFFVQPIEKSLVEPPRERFVSFGLAAVYTSPSLHKILVKRIVPNAW